MCTICVLKTYKALMKEIKEDLIRGREILCSTVGGINIGGMSISPIVLKIE